MLTSDDNTYKEQNKKDSMAGTLISVRVNQTLLTQARAVAKKRGATVQELVRESIRSMVEREQLSALYGSQRSTIERMTHEERDAFARKR